MGCGNHLPSYVNLQQKAQKSPPKVTINLHIRSGEVEGAQEDALLVKKLEALPHVTVKVTPVSKSLSQSLGAPYIVGDSGDRIRGDKLQEYLNNIR